MHKLTMIAFAAALPGAALAAHRMPGQWETTSSMRFTQGGPHIPPELLAQMQARGIKMPGMGEPHTFKSCLTPEKAAREEHPEFSDNKSCKQTNTPWSGNHFHAEFSCMEHGGETHGVVDGEVSDGGKRFMGASRVEGQNPALGGHFVMEGHYAGLWLGPTCSKDAS